MTLFGRPLFGNLWSDRDSRPLLVSVVCLVLAALLVSLYVTARAVRLPTPDGWQSPPALFLAFVLIDTALLGALPERAVEVRRLLLAVIGMLSLVLLATAIRTLLVG